MRSRLIAKEVNEVEIVKMNVSQVVRAMATKEATRQDVAKQVGASPKTVTRRLEALGYIWNNSLRRHEPTGATYKPENGSIIFAEYCKSMRDTDKPDRPDKPQRASQEVASTKEGKGMDRDNSKAQEKAEKAQEVSGTPQEKVRTVKSKGSHLADYLEGNKNIKTQRNYYMEDDVLAVINKVSSLQRSKFVNDCLRQCFKDYDLM